MLNSTTLRWRSLFILAALIVLFIPMRAASGQSPVIHAILFFSPSCPHCHQIMTEDLPPLQRTYDGQLDILEIDTFTEEGFALYKTAVETFKIPEDRQGVPTMIVGETILVGSLEIPGQLPGIIVNGLASGGIDWPQLPGLETLIQNREKLPEPTAVTNIWTLFQRDLLANILAVIVLIGLIVTLFYNLWLFNTHALKKKGNKKITIKNDPSLGWLIAALIAIGLFIAIYMTYIEATHSEAICGPVGDCNTVQQSPYATIFGILSVGLFGIIGYVCLTAALLIHYFGPQSSRKYGALLFFVMAVFGVVFSIYLTTLEPFVIGASCMWCLTTAVIMGLLLWLATKSAILAWNASRVKIHKRH